MLLFQPFCLLLWISICGIIPSNVAFGGSHEAPISSDSWVDKYHSEHLRIVGTTQFMVLQRRQVLTAIQFARITRQDEIARVLSRRHTLKALGGLTVATVGIGITTLGGALSVIGIIGGFGGVGMVSLSALTTIAGGFVIYGAVQLLEIRIPVHRVWSKQEAAEHINTHNRHLLFSNGISRKSVFRLKFGFAFEGNQFMISSHF